MLKYGFHLVHSVSCFEVHEALEVHCACFCDFFSDDGEFSYVLGDRFLDSGYVLVFVIVQCETPPFGVRRSFRRHV